ncbi:MAG: hypothetical protein IT289_08020 [Oligoflexia bacterium]|nr:hypothetical protein [Oligoflexia bacterium]
MLTEAHYRAALNFFYFLLLDEGLAISAADRVMRSTHRLVARTPVAKPDVILIGQLAKIFDSYQRRRGKIQTSPPRSDWKSSDPETLLAWKEFIQKRGREEFSVALTLHYLLGFSIEDLAEGLGVPEGTILHRLGRGLEQFSTTPFIQKKAGL